jgi:tetratricopeptide (TPR) repeat protein
MKLTCRKPTSINSAVRWLKRALDEDPHNTDALFWLIYLYAHAGHSAVARPLVKRLIRQDPLVPINHGVAGLTEVMDGNFEGALPHFRRWHEMEPEHPFSLWACAYVLVHNGRRDEANLMFDRLPCSDSPSVWDSLGLALKHALRADPATVQSVITPELKSLINTHEQFSWMAARFYALAGMKRESLNSLENAIALGFINYPFISEVDPFLENIRGEPRFKKLMERVKHEWENFEV